MATAKARRERKLPMQQLSILAICRFAEPIASTSLFPYLPEMVKSFNVPEDDVGKWAGICSSVFSICQAIMGVPWSRFSDRYGRKPAILLGLTCTMITANIWGFSRSLPVAIFARAVAGAGNGNVGILRTTVAEMVPFKELQPRAFSLMPLVWNVGSIFGPTIGGSLANPYDVKPGEQRPNGSLLERFPYALPNLVATAFFLVGIITGILFLEETLEGLRNRKDYGLILGRKLTRLAKSHIMTAKDVLRFRNQSKLDDEREPLLKSAEDEETLSYGPKKIKEPPPTYAEVLNKQAILNLVVYTLLALHNMGFDQLLPVFMQYPPLKSKVKDDAATILSSDNPLKFAGGFGLDHFRIGLIMTAYGIFGILVQFFLFPPVARHYGVLNCLKACAITYPITYFLLPFSALLPTTESQSGVCFGIMLVKCWCSIFAFPCSTILLTNSASSLRTLGTLNGFATSFSALGRAVGPYIGGNMFSFGVKRGYVIAAWWLYGGLAVIAAIPIFFLIEGEGFGDDEGHISDEEEIEEEEEEEYLRAEGLEGEAEAAGKPGPVLLPDPHRVEEEEEAQDVLQPITRTTTLSSGLSLGSDDYASPGTSRNASLAEGMPIRRSSQAPPGSEPALSRRGSRRVLRRTSLPFGMGSQPISRRYSSNLGQSFGTAGSYHGN